MAPVGCNVRENGQSDASITKIMGLFDEPSIFTGGKGSQNHMI